MATLMVLRMVLMLGLTLQCSSAPRPPYRRHVDSMFTSEFSRARGAAAVRKFINSAIGGKSFTREQRQENNQGTADSRVPESLNTEYQDNLVDKDEPGVLDSGNSRHQENDVDTGLRTMDPLTPSPEFSNLCSSGSNDRGNQVQALEENIVSDWPIKKKPGIGQTKESYFCSVL